MFAYSNDFIPMRIFLLWIKRCPVYLSNRPAGINFSEFIEALLATVFNSDPKERLGFVFDIYDLDDDGLISS